MLPEPHIKGPSVLVTVPGTSRYVIVADAVTVPAALSPPAKSVWMLVIELAAMPGPWVAVIVDVGVVIVGESQFVSRT